ncbi:hypothetical protein BY458DRAFT_445183 [Sporodiniella umbellata]|nr:hypothetical protein BY458DRAFT_445183 [Sporodiniella umbellata]
MKEAQHLLSKDTMHHLFGNLNVLVDTQRQFLVQVEEQAASAPQEQRFGLLFKQFEENFSVYEPFCANFQLAQELVVQVAYKLQKLDRLMSAAYELPAMLIKPIQRVCKYPLLLQQLIKATPEDWPYSQENKDGLEAIQRVTKKVNETKRVQENCLVVEELKKKLVIEDGIEIPLESYGPLLLHDRLILQKSDSDHTKESVVYLFEKTILICKEVKDSNKNSISIKKKRKEGSLIIKGRINMARVDHVKSSSSQTGNYAFMIHWTEKDVRQKMQLKCRNDEQLRQWLEVIITTKKETSAATKKLEPATPLSEFAPILDTYDDDGDDDLSQAQAKHGLDEDPHTDPNGFSRSRFYSYQYSRTPHHALHDPSNRKQSLGNPSLPPPRHYGHNPPPLPTTPLPSSVMDLHHTLPYSPPTSNPSSPHHMLPSGPAWPKRQGHEPVMDKLGSPVYKRNSQEPLDEYIKIKTHHKGQIYVVRVPSHIDFDELSKRIEDKLKTTVPTSTSISIAGLKYEDEDGDLITINSTEDVQMGFEIKGPNNVVNFHVTTVC